MEATNRSAGYLFRVIIDPRSYLNLVYLGAALPLGVFYLIFLVSGISLGISLTIIWVGIPLLVLVGIGWWWMARFERYLAVSLLQEDIPEMAKPSHQETGLWEHFRSYLENPVTWKSLLYLLLKFPLGLATFVILVIMVSLTLAFLSMPFTYQAMPPFQAGIPIGLGLPVWQIDSLRDALLCALIGLVLWPATLHITNGLALLHGKLARFMLSRNVMGWNPAVLPG